MAVPFADSAEIEQSSNVVAHVFVSMYTPIASQEESDFTSMVVSENETELKMDVLARRPKTAL